MAYIDHLMKDSVRVELVSKLLSDSIADEFSPNTPYVIGNLVMYEGGLYKFKAVHAAGSWNANHVDPVTVDSEIGEVKDALDNLVSYDSTNKKIVVTIPEKTTSGTKTTLAKGALLGGVNSIEPVEKESFADISESEPMIEPEEEAEPEPVISDTLIKEETQEEIQEEPEAVEEIVTEEETAEEIETNTEEIGGTENE